MTRRPAAIAALALAALLLSLPLTAASAADVQRASYSAVVNDLMCTSCHEPLALAQSPQAQAEKDAVKGLIARGMTAQQIENQMVAAFGVAVLAKPPASGFNLTVYILPPAVLVIGILILAYTLPKWRERSRQAAVTPLAHGQALTEADASRLNDELERFV